MDNYFFFDYKTSQGEFLHIKNLNFFEYFKFISLLDAIQSGKYSGEEASQIFEKIFFLFGISIGDLEPEDVSALLHEPGLLIKFVFGPTTQETDVQENKSKTPLADMQETIILNCWGLTNSFSETMFMLSNIPTPLLLSLLEKRGEVLEKAYSTPEERKTKEQRKLVEGLVKNARKSQPQ